MSKAKAILNVMAERQFRIVYQPVIEMSNGEIFSYEALLRPLTDDFNSPPAMFNAAVACGISGQFGRAVRTMTVENAPPTTLFINIHPTELGEGWLVRTDDPIFQHEDGVYLEVTESVPLTHFDLCESILNEVRGRGVRLAVDDLGAGYSNLKYIADLSPEIVKLDRNLIMDLHKSKRQQKLVTAIVRLCEDLDARCVAEGVETIDEFKALVDTGAHLLQGYLFARPAFPPPAVLWPPVEAAG